MGSDDFAIDSLVLKESDFCIPMGLHIAAGVFAVDCDSLFYATLFAVVAYANHTHHWKVFISRKPMQTSKAPSRRGEIPLDRLELSGTVTSYIGAP